MHGDRYVIAKSVIVQHIDEEEHDNIRNPTHQGNCPWLDEEGRIVDGKMRWPSKECSDDELDERDEKT